MTKDEMHEEIHRLIGKTGDINPSEVLTENMKGSSQIVVYGAGNMGSIFERFVKDLLPDMRISCFLDRNADKRPEHLGYPVYKPDDVRLNADFRRESLVVLALLLLQEDDYNELETQLRTLGYRKFINAFNQLGMDLPYVDSGLGDRRAFVREEKTILEAFDLLQDDSSQMVFLSVLKAHVTLNYNLPVQSPGMTQYVDVNVPFRHKYRAFVDCGAYNGDTLEELVKHHKVEHYFGFEPDMQSYARLLQRTDTLRDKIGQAMLLPLGVGGKNEFLWFRSTAGGNSKVEDTGDTMIQVVRLDDVLKGYDKLMIKMDIEGAEVAALEGAKGIITTTKPDLAICVYHRVSDLWRISLMLKEWVPEYQFYLRNHFMGTFETVLYATQGK